MAEYNKFIYKISYFCGGSNIIINLIMCEDKIYIPLILQRYVLHWYHKYLLNSRMDRTEAMICRFFYWPEIRTAIRKEVK